MPGLDDLLPDAEWLHDPGFVALVAALDPAGEGDGVRIVGGAVRDSLIGLPVKDVDLATPHAPEEVIRRLEAAGIRHVPTGLAHGTVTALTGSGPVEITTLRRDVSTDGRRATVAFSGDWREDAARRDFTMNALYAEPVSRRLHDYFGGRAHLAARRLRFIGDARQRIDEDHLRILRYFRFLARFGDGGTIDADYAACVDKAPTMMALSRERVADELLKLLGVADPVPALRLMVAGGIFAPIVPEINAAGVERVAANMVRETAMGLAPDGLLRFMALLPQDAAIADRVAARLKLSNKARARIVLAQGEAVAGDARTLAYRLGLQGALDRIALGLALSPEDAAGLTGWTPPRMPLSGKDLIARGLVAGPEVSRMLKRVEAAWIAANYPTREDALKLVDQFLAG